MAAWRCATTRTHEINRRLVARGHEVTVLTTRFPGCADRVQDGVTYLHVGAGRGGNKWTRLLGYVQGLPRAARKLPADLVVEDFFAPFSSMAAPRWTGRPTIGMVQWLHAEDKSRQYKLPLHVLERIGVRSHRLLVAVSQGTAERLRALNPAAHVEVIGNGVERAAFAVPPCAGRDVVYVGRLEYGGKGLDLLLAAWAQVHRMVEGDLVIAGGGPDEDRVRREVDRLGLAKRVRFVGWVTGEAKWRLLAGARLAVVPSRHETFGMVALEAMATATPVVAFDIPGLREVVPDGCGWRVPPFDVPELADRIRAACADPALARAAGLAGRRFAAGFDWDVLADRQDEVYRSVLEEAAAR